MLPRIVRQFQSELKKELTERILPFWMEKTPDYENGGFYGQISNDLKVAPGAEKSCILNSRILWTFSAAYRLFNSECYLETAKRAYDYLRQYFWDDQYSGLYFMVNERGGVTNPRKQVYNLAFGIYGLSEYYRAAGEVESLNLAIELYRLIEEYCYDGINKGYFEACARDWLLTGEMRLSPRDLNEKKSLNTHLHLVEAYTNLLRVWENDRLRNSLKELMELFSNRIIDPGTGHFKLFFDEQWNSKTNLLSYGHDIEGSWLLYEAAEVLGEENLIDRIKGRSVLMAQKVYEEGVDVKNGVLFDELENGTLRDSDKVWWIQCEAMVGFLNAFQLTGAEYFFNAAYEVWRFCDQYLLDKENGEWFNEVSRDGKYRKDYYKVGPWKCPYHNGRACMEIITRLQNG